MEEGFAEFAAEEEEADDFSCGEIDVGESLPPATVPGQASLHAFLNSKKGTNSGGPWKSTRARLREVSEAHPAERTRSRSPMSSSPSESGVGFPQEEPWSATDSELGFRQHALAPQVV